MDTSALKNKKQHIFVSIIFYRKISSIEMKHVLSDLTVIKSYKTFFFLCPQFFFIYFIKIYCQKESNKYDVIKMRTKMSASYFFSKTNSNFQNQPSFHKGHSCQFSSCETKKKNTDTMTGNTISHDVTCFCPELNKLIIEYPTVTGYLHQN